MWKDLLKNTEYIINEARAQFKNVGVLWSGGKDSTTTLHIIKNMYGQVPFDVLYIDTGFDFPETQEFIKRVADEWNIRLKVVRNSEAKATYRQSRETCCYERKTLALRKAIESGNYDAIIVSIRRDEHGIRNKERFFSPRKQDFTWDYSDQPLELAGWGIFFRDFEGAGHIRVHPLLEWSLIDVWEYVRDNGLPVNPLYFKGYTSIGCYPCTVAVASPASDLDEIIERVKKGIKEREGRRQDDVMQKLRALGYM